RLLPVEGLDGTAVGLRRVSARRRSVLLWAGCALREGIGLLAGRGRLRLLVGRMRLRPERGRVRRRARKPGRLLGSRTGRARLTDSGRIRPRCRMLWLGTRLRLRTGLGLRTGLRLRTGLWLRSRLKRMTGLARLPGVSRLGLRSELAGGRGDGRSRLGGGPSQIGVDEGEARFAHSQVRT